MEDENYGLVLMHKNEETKNHLPTRGKEVVAEIVWGLEVVPITPSQRKEGSEKKEVHCDSSSSDSV